MKDKIDDLQKAIESFGYKFDTYKESPLPGFKIGFEMPGTNDRQELLVFFMNSYDVSAILQDEYNINVMNISYIFPDAVVRKAQNDIMLLTNRINMSCILPGFGYDKDSGKVFFRFCLPVVDFESGKEWLHETLRLIIDHIAIYSDAIGNVSLGNLTFDEFVQESQTTYLNDLKYATDKTKS